MSELIGARINPELDPDQFDEDELLLAHRLTAWTVPALIGSKIEIRELGSIGEAVRQFMAKALPGIEWWVEESWQGPFIKYGFLHGSIPAPPNEATGEPMAIELFGIAEGMPELGTEAWHESVRLHLGMANTNECLVPLPTLVRIQVAVYSNLMYPGLGVPMYF